MNTSTIHCNTNGEDQTILMMSLYKRNSNMYHLHLHYKLNAAVYFPTSPSVKRQVIGCCNIWPCSSRLSPASSLYE